MNLWSWLSSSRPTSVPPRRMESAGALDPAWRAIHFAASDAQRSRLPQMAAALSYRTLFGLLPIAVVGLIVVRTVTSREKQAEVLGGVIEKLGLSNIAVPSTPALNSGFVGPMPADLDRSQSLSDWVTALIYRADANVNFQAIGIIGVLTLVYAAISMLVEIERAFNQIFRVPEGRSWTRRIVNYWTLMTLGAGALAATFSLGALFEKWTTQLVQVRGWQIGSGAITLALVGYVVTVAISTLLLLLTYLSVPNTRVRAVPALAGAFFAALLWEAGKWGFAQYIGFSTNYAKLYGSIALIPLFMLWVYVTWFIVLFGLQTTYQLQHGLKNTRAQPIADSGPVIFDPALAVRLMSALARAFDQGKQPTLAHLSASSGVPLSVASVILAGACERGLTLRIERHDDPAAEPTYTPARPPSAMSVAEVLEIAYTMADQRAQPDHTTRRLRDAQVHAAGKISLAELNTLEAARVTGEHAYPLVNRPLATSQTPTPRSGTSQPLPSSPRPTPAPVPATPSKPHTPPDRR